MSDKFISHFRREYLGGELEEENMLESPYQQMLEWLEDAARSGIKDPNAMSLASVGDNGKPSVRVVLLKEAREEGLVFLTNYESRKGSELLNNPHAAVLFFWSELDRQLRIEGEVTKLSSVESDKFFNSRPLNSRISSVISPQSSIISSRDELELKHNELLRSKDHESLQRPDYWGGYILKPLSYEFWQGRENRLNDRILYEQKGDDWLMNRLAP